MSELGIETVGLYNGHTNLKLKKTQNTRTICDCCPYGYHIDLGFVEFCDRLAKANSEPSPSKKERRERRRQRQSMEVLLGLTNPKFWNVQQLLPTLFLKNLQKDKTKMGPCFGKHKEHSFGDFVTERPVPRPPVRKSSYVYDSEGLKKAVEDFEATLERTTNINFRNLPVPDIYANPDKSKMTLPKAEEVIHLKTVAEVYGESTPVAETTPLQNIRAQMAISLEKIKEMEVQVKVLPYLEEQLTSLEKENYSLDKRVKELTKALADKCNELLEYKISLKNQTNKKKTRDVGALCSPKTREVGILTTPISRKTSSTETIQSLRVDASTATDLAVTKTSIFELSKGISLRDLDTTQSTLKSSKSTQTGTTKPGFHLPVNEKRDFAIQTDNITREVAVTAKPKTTEASIEAKTPVRDVGVSDNTLKDKLCDRCENVKTKSVGVGSANVKDPVPSLGLVNRSKSFDTANFKRTRSIGVSTIPPVKKLTATKQVGTVEVSVVKKHIGVNTTLIKTHNVAITAALVDKKIENKDDKVQSIEKVATIEDAKKAVDDEKEKEPQKRDILKDGNYSSKIPRPTGVKTPVMSRKKFSRQDTYSKTIPVACPELTPQKMGLESSPEKPELPDDQVQVTLRKKTPKEVPQSLAEVERQLTNSSLDDQGTSAASTSRASRYSGYYDDGGYDYDEQYGEQESNRNSQMFPDTALFQPIQEKPREKLVPSKEMKAAMKVVNDGLHKFPNGLPKHLKNACNIIQLEWFKLSSTADANPLDVEDYLDSFEEVSSALLEFVVNMIDVNGNTAMHYAVSHGNFDVVSILLDSKVCNINKTNAAGYTCVMLVSLAIMRSETHRQVVRRLFHLADVNVRAKQHGQTALMLAVSHGRLEMVQMLLEAGADPNIQDCDGSTALMCAAEHGHLEIVKLILAHPDCDPAIVDCDGCSALAIAMEAGNRDIGVLLYAREHFAPSSRGSSPYTSTRRRNRPSSSPQSAKTPTSPKPNKRPDSSI